MSSQREPLRALAALEREPGEHVAVQVLRARWPGAAGLALGALHEIRGRHARTWVLVGLGAVDARVLFDPNLPVPSTLPRAAGTRRFPSTQANLFLQVGADDRDALMAVLRELDRALAPFCWRDEEVAGGWGAGHREPFGFRETAKWTRQRAEAVTIQTGIAAGSTWLLYLRFETDRERFLAHREREQIAIMGAEHSGTHLSTPRDDAHVARVHAYGARMLRRGFPYRIAGTEGLAFVAVAASPDVFAGALDSMLGAHGPADRLLDYANAVSAGVYFVPAHIPRVPAP